MNAIELLEALLRGPGGGQQPEAAQRQGSAASGSQILRDILQGGTPETAEPPPPARSTSREPWPSGGAPASSTVESEKQDVQELVRQAEERAAAAASGRPYRPPSAPSRSPAPASATPEGWPARRDQRATMPAAESAPAPREEEATFLIRAMIHATRADGRLDREEEQKLLRQLGEPGPEVIAFIQAEFQKPLDVKEFAWSIPLGLEQKVYAISLSVIDVDQREESDYLQQLARGLRLAPDVCAQLHQRFGAPPPR